MRVGLHPEARAEFRSAALWYEERRDGLGVEFVAAVDAALLRIGKAPKSFPQWVGTEQAPAVIRKASVEGFPYVIAFEEYKRHAVGERVGPSWTANSYSGQTGSASSSRLDLRGYYRRLTWKDLNSRR